MAHFLFQLLVHLFRFPVVVRIVLHLFEVADRHSSGIREDVRYDGNASLEEDVISLGDGWSVGKFHDESRLNVIDIFSGNLVLERCRNEDVAGLNQELSIAHLLSELCFVESPLLLFPCENNSYIESICIVERCFGIRYTD